MVASQDWPEVTKYAGLVCAQAHRQELIQDLYKTWHDPVRGTVSGGMIRYIRPHECISLLNTLYSLVLSELPLIYGALLAGIFLFPSERLQDRNL